MRPSIYFNRLSLTLLWSRPRASKDLNIVYCNDWDANRSLIFGRESEGCLGIYRNVCKELVRDGKESSITDSTKLIYEDFSKSKKELKQCKRENFSSPEEVETERFNKWYHVDMCSLPQDLQASFVQSSLDEETQQFLRQSVEKSSWVMTQVWHCLVKTFLNVFMTQTSINGLLRRGSMFVFSKRQFLNLTDWNENPEESGTRRMLDLGAGDGVVTSVIAKLFKEVYATEVSQPMRWILAEKGFNLLDVEKWATQEEIKFDVVSCLNLLDRCDRPYDILADAKKVLKPNGILVLALVLPFKPYVEVSVAGRQSHMPLQMLKINGSTFEEQVVSLVRNVLEPLGYEVLSWSRVPYLCEGDLRQSYYWLDDAIFILKPA